ncbi:MAG TPA: hypothetical protein VLF91_01375 [Candidatus Saccharimonadales bacterium]|nr:hypothetical protein [Candidatus Saccharimonadales bacterium]
MPGYEMEPAEAILLSAPAAEPREELSTKTAEQLAAEAYSQIHKDLYLSFMLAQGRDLEQHAWESSAAAYIHSTWEDEKLAQLPAALAKMGESIAEGVSREEAAGGRSAKTNVPAKHLPTARRAGLANSPARQYAAQWQAFCECIVEQKPTTEDEKTLTMPTTRIARMARSLMSGDLIYQNRERSGGLIFAPNDLHASLFKVFVIDGVSTSSEAYDAVIGLVRSLYTAAANDEQLRSIPHIDSMMKDIEQLRTSWQSNHPGEVFDADPQRSEVFDSYRRGYTEAALGEAATGSV